MIERDLFEEVPELEVPFTVIQGRQDYFTAGEVAERWFQGLNCPLGKEFHWFERSAHWPQIEENGRFVEVVMGRVR